MSEPRQHSQQEKMVDTEPSLHHHQHQQQQLLQQRGPVRVVVIGAGIAGLAAARYLVDACASQQLPQLELTVLESSERVGGRIFTSTVDEQQQQQQPLQQAHDGPERESNCDARKELVQLNLLELGAQWLHGTIGNPLYELAKRQQLLQRHPNSTVRSKRNNRRQMWLKANTSRNNHDTSKREIIVNTSNTFYEANACTASEVHRIKEVLSAYSHLVDLVSDGEVQFVSKTDEINSRAQQGADMFTVGDFLQHAFHSSTLVEGVLANAYFVKSSSIFPKLY